MNKFPLHNKKNNKIQMMILKNINLKNARENNPLLLSNIYKIRRSCTKLKKCKNRFKHYNIKNKIKKN